MTTGNWTIQGGDEGFDEDIEIVNKLLRMEGMTHENPEEDPHRDTRLEFDPEKGKVLLDVPNRNAPLEAPILHTFSTGEGPDKKRIALLALPLRGPKEIVDQATRRDPPAIFTRLRWLASELPDRIEASTKKIVNADALVSDNMVEVFPEDTLKWLSAWQYLINTGAVMHANGVYGEFSHTLINAGFCALPPTRVPGFWKMGSSRFDVRGEQGSMQFVEAMMGPQYAEWLRAVPS